MKSHKGDLVQEISKLQAMVLELRAGFSRALLELNQIQLGDTELQSQLEETRHGCNKRALHLETLVLSLREELEEIRTQIRQLCGDQNKSEATSSSVETQCDSAAGCSGVKNGTAVNGVSDDSGSTLTPPLCSVGGALLLHCYLQGLRAGHGGGGDSQVSSRGAGLQSHTLPGGRRRRVAASLLRSEWDYVSSLAHLLQKYKSPPAASAQAELHKAFARHVDQMLQRHLLFRNSLEECVSGGQSVSAVGDAFTKLTGQDSTAFCDAYLGYMTTLATILSTEFSREQPDKQQNSQEERFWLLSLLLAPVSRLRTYLNTIQLWLASWSSVHSDWRPLQDTEQLLQKLCRRCHMTLERAGHWAEGAGPLNSPSAAALSSSRFCPESFNSSRSAFTRYRSSTRAGTAHCSVGNAMTANGHQREHCHLAVPQPLLPPAGILRNGHERVCEQQLSPSCGGGGWSDGCGWNCRPGDCTPTPPCQMTLISPVHRPQQLFLNPVAPPAVDLQSNLKSPSGLAERLCGSPGPDGVCRAELYPPPHRLDDADTDADVGDASVFDYSSVTTCSPDTATPGPGAEEDEEDDEEDSEIPVLLKPSYTAQRPPGATLGPVRESSVCTRWQIPRAAPLPSEVNVVESGTGRRRNTKTLRRIPAGAFRPIWGAPYRQGDSAPAKESTVSFSNTTQIINSQCQSESSRLVCRGACGSPVGAQRRGGLWEESEDSEGPCSTV